MDLGYAEQCLTVHHYGPVNQTPPDDTYLIDKGKAVLTSAVVAQSWHPVVPLVHRTASGLSRNSYEYVLRPPTINGHSERYPSLREWGSDVLDHEKFRLDDLEEFSSTKFDQPFLESVLSPLRGSQRSLLTPSRNISRNLRETASQERRDPAVGSSPKRRRLHTGSLYKIIERPHLYTVPRVSPELESMEPESKFKGSLPMALPPYMLQDVRSIFEDSYARSIWVIPVRGTPPYPDCTPAVLLQQYPEAVQNESERNDDADVPACTSIPSATSSELIWTQDALRSCWNFLLQLRDAYTLGPIALSFHVAAASRENSDVKATAPTDSTTASKKTAAPTVLDMDHIKVYHDARYAVHLRNVLRAWTYECTCVLSDIVLETALPTSGAPITAIESRGLPERKTKVRLMKNVRLVLLDERCRGILTC